MVQALEDGDAKARGYVSSILQFDLIIALCATEHVPLNDAVLLISSVFYLDNRKFENISTEVLNG